MVIPAHNAAATIAETLRSVQSQTHRALEIIVVDDGSTDSTRSIVDEYAAADPRIRLLIQRNAGVAAARNNGWLNARSGLIAFIDADDLWSPHKLERQLHMLEARGSQVGLVYSWFAMIDGNSQIIDKWPGPSNQGRVLDALFENNFIGNGSSALLRREALVAANGFDSALRAANAQGCEDFLFYCRVAENFDFAVVPYHDVGYRFLRDNMSSNAPRMLRSWLLVMAELQARHPDKRALLLKGLRRYARRLVRQALFARRSDQVAETLLVLLRQHPRIAADMMFRVLPGTVAGSVTKKLRRAAARTSENGSQSRPRFRIGEGVPLQAGSAVGRS